MAKEKKQPQKRKNDKKEQHKNGEQKQYYICGTHYLGIGKKYMLLKPHLWDG